MEPGFWICPFCRSPTAVEEERCPDCRRSLVGLALKVHHVPSRAADLTAAPERRTGRSRRAGEPARAARSKRMALALAAGVLMGISLGWIVVRAVGHEEDPETTTAADADGPEAAAAAPAETVPATLPPAPTTLAATPKRVVVRPRVSETAIPETGAEYQRLRRARRTALELAEGRREARTRQVRRLEDQLAVIEDPDARAQMQDALDEAFGQLEAAEKEVARLRGETGE